MNYDDICYSKTSLSQVIIRVDFLEFFDNSIIFESPIEKEILKSFPKKGMRQKIGFQAMRFFTDTTGQRTEHTTQEGIQQDYYDSDGNKTIVSNKFIIFEVNHYKTFEITLDNFSPILKQIIDNKEITSMRTGIRYINIFNENSIKPQKNYFKSNIGSLFEANQKSSDCIRTMAMSEYLIEDMQLNFRFGMFNPQYPQIIRKNDYVLDYDCFIDEAITGYESIIDHITTGHDNIQRLFEDSITDQLRKVMD